jgi:hypothetical protein
MFSPALMVTVSACVAVLLAESVTLAVNVAVPAVGEEPDNTPAAESVSPTELRLPDEMLQVYPVPLPPLAASVCEYATPA